MKPVLAPKTINSVLDLLLKTSIRRILEEKEDGNCPNNRLSNV
jgi:hypothetical protein